MTGDDLRVLVHRDRNIEAEGLDALGDLRTLFLAVQACVASIRLQLAGRDIIDLRRGEIVADAGAPTMDVVFIRTPLRSEFLIWRLKELRGGLFRYRRREGTSKRKALGNTVISLDCIPWSRREGLHHAGNPQTKQDCSRLFFLSAHSMQAF